MQCNSAIEAEAYALILGMELALEYKIDKLMTESDNKGLIAAIKVKKLDYDWRIYQFMEHIFRLMDEFSFLSWEWISRKANRTADAAAMLSKRRSLSLEWTTNPPSPIFSVLKNDGLPCPHSGL